MKQWLFLDKIRKRTGKVQNPDFFIIGAQKSGTSTLHSLLDRHSELSGSRKKETHFFDRDIHFNMTVDAYRRNFRGPKRLKYFESTPEYLYHPDVPDLIKRHYPDSKFIVILRDPVARAYSAWNHYRHLFGDKEIEHVRQVNRRPGNLLYSLFFENRDVFPSFMECMQLEVEHLKLDGVFEPALLRRGLYYDQLQRWENYFRREQFLIIGFSDLIEKTDVVLQHTGSFLGCRAQAPIIENIRAHNSRSYQAKMTHKEFELASSFFRHSNSLLFNTYGNINW